MLVPPHPFEKAGGAKGDGRGHNWISWSQLLRGIFHALWHHTWELSVRWSVRGEQLHCAFLFWCSIIIIIIITFQFLSYKTVNSLILLFCPLVFSSIPLVRGSEPAAVLCLAACWIKPWHPCMDHLPTGPILRCQELGKFRAEAVPPSFTFVLPQLGCCCRFAAVSQWQPSASSLCFPDNIFPYSSATGSACVDRHPGRCWVSQAPSSTGRVS